MRPASYVHLALAPAEFAAQEFEEGAAHPQEFDAVGGFAALDLVSLYNWHSDLTVDAEDAVGAAFKAHRDVSVSADDKRAMGERVRTDRGQQDGLDAGHEDRASGGQRIGSGAGRGGHDHAIGLVLHRHAVR